MKATLHTEAGINEALKRCDQLILQLNKEAEVEARKALQAAIALQNRELIALSYCSMSLVCYSIQFDNVKSYEYATLAAGVAETLPLCFAKVSAEHHLAQASFRLRDYTQTLKILSVCRQMLGEFEENNLQLDTLRWGVFNTTALVYINIGLFRLAKPYFDLSLEYAMRTGNADIIRRSRIAVASHLFRIKEYTQARQIFRELHGEHSELPLHETSAIIYHYMGII